MQENNKSKSGLHIRPFWAVTIVAVVAAVAGGIIYFYTQANELQDDIYSISFISPIQIHKQKNPTSTKLPVSQPQATTSPAALKNTTVK
ncbi:MAG: hypothetical protein P4L74_00755 [Candidatus Doudnabacteria bacterium]|nr:hypothetical protein [Candidatus Doudnabacteria bacterium]